MDNIVIKGAKENNLKNIDIVLPREKLIVFTGLSGSGKTSLAFDTIFAEGQRRYMESLSSYARQFLGQMNKPDVESIEGLSPTIAIDQKTTARNPRSTVGTVTEIYDYLRLLYARVGVVHCPSCGKEISQQTVDQIIDKVLRYPKGTKIMINAPVVRGRKGEFKDKFELYRKSGFARVNVDGKVYSLDEDITLDRQCKHDVSVVIDRIVVKSGIRTRLSDSIETALKLAEGLVVISKEDGDELFSTKYACPDCGVSIEEVEPRLFSFNSPFGACPRCTGLGFLEKIDPTLIYGDGSKSINEGALAITGWGFDSDFANMYFRALSKKYGFSLDTPFRELPEEIRRILLYGNGGEKLNVSYSSSNFSGSYSGTYEGVINNLERRYRESTSEYIKSEIRKFIRESACPECHGRRLKKEALAVTVGGLNISQLCDMSVVKMYGFVSELSLSPTQAAIAKLILKEIKARLKFLIDVGLGYLTLSRGASTLSGGEAQRIRLATQIGSGLTGVLYILDEPSIGLHQRDNEKLIATLKRLRDLGNTLIVVEHDEDTIRAADYVLDIGPGAGVHGGSIVASGTPEEIMNSKDSLTGAYLRGDKRIEIPTNRRKPKGYVSIKGASENNLKNIDVDIPLGVITAITGVSGSGKSTLINQTLSPAISNELMGTKLSVGKCKSISGLEQLDKIIVIDQSPIGRTPRSNPATYTGVFSFIRELFAKTQDALQRGYKAGRFSFNVSGGRCEHCQGDGIIKIEMNFLPDVYVPCEVCGGKRYNKETLEVRYKGKNIAEVLEMTIEEAVHFFEGVPSVYNKIKTLFDVGLGYVKLGQSATTLSGGEAQRVKLATELSRRATGRTLYVLDEPTTGLHMADVDKLITIMQKLVDNGNSIVVIEHNLDVIKIADHIIDLGPEGGDGGGTIIATGTPEDVAKIKESFTGRFLEKVLKNNAT